MKNDWKGIVINQYLCALDKNDSRKSSLVKSLKDYKYTTFEKFVKLGLYEENWCNFEDKNKIADLDFE